MVELNKHKIIEGWTKVEYHFIDNYAKHLSPFTCFIYIFLKRYKNKDSGLAFPGEDFIAAELGISTQSVGRHLKVLVNHHFVIIRKSKYKGKWLHNNYEFRDRKSWLTEPCDFKSYGGEWIGFEKPCDKYSKNHVTICQVNNINIKHAQEKETKRSPEVQARISGNLKKVKESLTFLSEEPKNGSP